MAANGRRYGLRTNKTLSKSKTIQRQEQALALRCMTIIVQEFDHNRMNDTGLTSAV